MRGIERTEHTDDRALKGLIYVSIGLQLLLHLVNYQIQNAEGIAKNVIFSTQNSYVRVQDDASNKSCYTSNSLPLFINTIFSLDTVFP